MNAELKKILADTFGLPETQIADNASMDNLTEWDSVAHINVVLALESQYGLSFSPDEILALSSVQKIEDVLKQRGVGI
jgi:acyl carrier protein